MNTIHDAIKHTAKLVPQSQRELFISEIEKITKHIREKTIDECIACVPEKIDLSDEWETALTDFNTCREKTITNLTQLKNNG